MSKNYHNITKGGNKARTDIEKILSESGYKHAGLAQTVYSNAMIGFILNLVGISMVFFKISADDTVIIQYPFKKFYSFLCNTVHLKKGKVITVIHDLAAFRRKQLTVEQEINLLNHSDVLIVHNHVMRDSLQNQGYKKPIVCLEIFDYLSSSVNDEPHPFDEQSIKVMYAGTLRYKKNKFLYYLDGKISKWQLELYGSGFEEKMIKNKDSFKYCGFIQSDQLVKDARANFGLVWDGDGISSCSGNIGEYLRVNNPHKASLYIRCNCPVIIWKEAALASFVADNKIGICVQSLEELDTVLSSVTLELYNEMVENCKIIDKKISSGYYLTKALGEAIKLL